MQILIQTQGLNILTDPIWSNRASPYKNIGPKRYSPPGIPFEKLPPIDLVLITHNHYDHLDVSTIKNICNAHHPRIITPLGNDRFLPPEAYSMKIETLDWHKFTTISDAITLHLLPCQHWSARGIFDKNKALWGVFVIETPGGNIYFCGDTGYERNNFCQALQQFGSFRFAALPIGAYEPRWLMKYAHMNPEDAVLAHKDLGEPYTIATHFETFQLTDEGFDDPRISLSVALNKHLMSPQKFRALKIGEAWMVPETSTKP